MQFFWKCEECDETNLYPDVKVCGTCGTPMSQAAEQRVLQEQKEEAARQEQIRKEEERRRKEEERRRKEEERRRLAALKAAEEAEKERQRLAKLELALQRRSAREARISGIYRRLTRALSLCMVLLAALAMVFTVVLFVRDADQVRFEGVYRNTWETFRTEYFAHTTPSSDPWEEADPWDEPESGRSSRVLENVRAGIPPAFDTVFSNAREQFLYLRETYTPIENISALIDRIMEFLSGGSEDGNV